MVFSQGDGVWTWSNASAETRICVQDRRIAWAHCTSAEIYLADRLADALDLHIDELRLHVIACREANLRLPHYLAEIQAMSRDQLRAVLREHTAEHLDAFFTEEWDAVEFEPSSERHDATLTFELDEILLDDESTDPMAVDSASVARAIARALEIDGTIGVAVVDYGSGMCVAAEGDGRLDVDVAAAGQASLVRAQLQAMQALRIEDGIEDILISLTGQWHLIRPLAGTTFFLYLVLDCSNGHLAMARHQLRDVERSFRG